MVDHQEERSMDLYNLVVVRYGCTQMTIFNEASANESLRLVTALVIVLSAATDIV